MTFSKYPQQRSEWLMFIESLELYMFNVEGLMPGKRDVSYVNVCGTFRFCPCYMSIYWEIFAVGYTTNLQGV